jgi:hypothetical protein
MTASELLKEWILEQALTSDEISIEDREWVKTFEDLVEWCKEQDGNFKYDVITEELLYSDSKIYHNKEHEEYSLFSNQYVYKIKDKFVQIWIPSDEHRCTYEFIKEILEEIDNAKFVEPYQELVTYYKAI